jgi:hypothetical protein
MTSTTSSNKIAIEREQQLLLLLLLALPSCRYFSVSLAQSREEFFYRSYLCLALIDYKGI